jgi:hypothetical protein
MKNALKSIEVMEKELAKLKSALTEGQADSAEEAGDNELDLDTLEDLDDKEIKQIAKDAGISLGRKFDREAAIEAIREFYGADEAEEDEEEDEDGEEQDLEDMDDEELIALAEEHDVEVPYTGKGKSKKLDRDALIEALQEAMGGDDEDEDEESEDEEDEDEDGAFDEDTLNDMDDEELVQAAEEVGVEPVYEGKGKKKKLDREATIEAILEAQGGDEDEDADDDEDESDEDTLEIYDEEDLDDLDEEELKAHFEELVEYCEENDIEVPKVKKKNAAGYKKAILEIYEALEGDEE